MAGHAASESHLGLPPRFPIRVFLIVVAVTLDVHGCGVGLAVPPTPGGEDGEAVARAHVDGVLAA